jgi:hypothetical protein
LPRRAAFDERQASSVEDAIRRYEIDHPIVHDPKMTIWQAYDIEAWSTLPVEPNFIYSIVMSPRGRPKGSAAA